MKESVKQFCSLNRLDSVTVEQIYTAYLRAENDEIRVKANTDDAGGRSASCNSRGNCGNSLNAIAALPTRRLQSSGYEHEA